MIKLYIYEIIIYYFQIVLKIAKDSDPDPTPDKNLSPDPKDPESGLRFLAGYGSRFNWLWIRNTDNRNWPT